MNTYSLAIRRYAQPICMEPEALTRIGFTPEEIASLLQLRDRYQHGGSDRAEVLHYWKFLKFLLSTGKLSL